MLYPSCSSFRWFSLRDFCYIFYNTRLLLLDSSLGDFYYYWADLIRNPPLNFSIPSVFLSYDPFSFPLLICLFQFVPYTSLPFFPLFLLSFLQSSHPLCLFPFLLSSFYSLLSFFLFSFMHSPKSSKLVHHHHWIYFLTNQSNLTIFKLPWRNNFTEFK